MKKQIKQFISQCKPLNDSSNQRFLDQLEIICAILDNQKKSILACNLSYDFLYANKQGHKLLKKNVKNYKLPIWLLFNHELIASMIEKALNIEYYGRLEDIKLNNRIVSITIDSLVLNNCMQGYLISLEDLTNQRISESYLRKQENLASVAHITASVAHEIKNPLASMSIRSQLLKRSLSKTNLNNEILQDIKIIDDEIERLNKVIINYLYTAKPLNLILERINLCNLIENVITFLEPEIDKHGVKLNFSCFSETIFILLDASQVRQALINLIQNAVNACQNNGIINISLNQDSNSIYLHIKDNGHGISPEIGPKIFEPYFTTKNSGSGLGLVLVYKIIKEHGANINFKSPPDNEVNGTEFVITFNKPTSEKLLTFVK